MRILYSLPVSLARTFIYLRTLSVFSLSHRIPRAFLNSRSARSIMISANFWCMSSWCFWRSCSNLSNSLMRVDLERPVGVFRRTNSEAGRAIIRMNSNACDVTARCAVVMTLRPDDFLAPASRMSCRHRASKVRRYDASEVAISNVFDGILAMSCR
jgi:hypothetical protein